MNILFMTLSAVLFLSTSTFMFLFFKLKSKLKGLKEVYLTTNRKGFYTAKIHLLSESEYKIGEKGDPYNFIIYVEEIDRYQNGLSKIKMTDIELTSGFDTAQFDHAKKIMISKFSSLKKTDEIEWLESENSIKEERRLKLKKIGIK